MNVNSLPPINPIPGSMNPISIPTAIPVYYNAQPVPSIVPSRQVQGLHIMLFLVLAYVSASIMEWGMHRYGIHRQHNDKTTTTMECSYHYFYTIPIFFLFYFVMLFLVRGFNLPIPKSLLFLFCLAIVAGHYMMWHQENPPHVLKMYRAVHHKDKRECNYNVCLPLADHLFGTYQSLSSAEVLNITGDIRNENTEKIRDINKIDKEENDAETEDRVIDLALA